MLTLTDIAQAIAKVEYKPEWSFHVFDDEYEGHHLTVVVSTGNPYRNHPIVLAIRSPMPPFDSETEFWRWLLWRIRRIEAHEAREWFHVNGEPFSDPHREAP